MVKSLKWSYLDDVRQGLKEVLELGVPVVCHPALPAKVVVVRWDELVEGHLAARGCLQQINKLAGKERQLSGKGSGSC